MKNVLVVVDMQNDFVTGVLGSKEAREILPKVEEKVNNFDGAVIFTRDTHTEEYMYTQEGKNLPIPHCIEGTSGWEIVPQLQAYSEDLIIDKPTFGSKILAQMLEAWNQREKIDSITFIGVCTDICVISNAMLVKAFLPEVPIIVDASCCAGVTPDSHKMAIASMKACQIQIDNEQDLYT